MEDGAAEVKSRKQNNDTARERLIHHNGRLVNLQLGYIAYFPRFSQGTTSPGYCHVEEDVLKLEKLPFMTIWS